MGESASEPEVATEVNPPPSLPETVVAETEEEEAEDEFDDEDEDEDDDDSDEEETGADEQKPN